MKSKELRRMASRICLGFISVVFIFFVATPTAVRAQKVDPATYYKGKTIEVIVPLAPGGGADITARFVSGWLTKFIPGNPFVVIRNMPGANGLIGANFVYNIAKKDGLTVMLGYGGVNLNSLLQFKGCEYDLNKMPLVLACPSANITFIKGDLIKNFKDIFEKEMVIFGHLPPGGSVTTTFILTKELLGFKTQKMILAYQGSGDARRAFLAGEVNVTGDTVQAYEANIKPLEKSGEIKILWQSGTLDPAGNVIKVDPPLGHIPSVYDRYLEVYGKPPSGNVWEALKMLIGAVAVFDKPLNFPPGTPTEIVNILAASCERMIKDPKFIVDANAKLRSTFVAGEPMRKTYDKTMRNANPEVVRWLKTWLREKWGVE